MAKKKMAWIIILILVIVLAVLILINRQDGLVVETTTPRPTPTPTPAARTQPTPAADTAQQTQAYTELLQEYEGKRIQFDANCQAIPQSSTFKNGTKVMFDNRSGDARIITIDGVQYNFEGFGYHIVALSSKTLPRTISLGCGSAVNVGLILIQN